MSVDPPADPFTASHADPGRPDPLPSTTAASAWPAPAEAAALNPLADVAGGSALDAFAPAAGPHDDPRVAAARLGDVDGGDREGGGEGATWTPVDSHAAWPLSDGVEVLAPEPTPDPLSDWPAPAAAPAVSGVPAAPVTPVLPPAATSFAEAPTAAAPSRPSVPWDRHQDPPPIVTAARGPAAALAAKTGVNLVYAAGAAVVGFLLLTALFFNVLVRTTDDDARTVGASVPGAPPPAGEVDGAGEAAAAGDIAPGGADPTGVSAAEGAAAGSGAETADAGPENDLGGGTAPMTIVPGAAGSGADAAASEVDAAFIVPAGYRRYDDPQHGFSLRVPAGWREARRSATPGDAAEAPDYDVVFEAEGGEQRLAVSVWSAADRPPFDAWLPTVAAGLRPLDDGAAPSEGVPFNAFLAGESAVVLGAPETAVSRLAYAAFLAHGERYLRIAWADLTGVTRPDEILGALASFGWVGDDIVTGSAAPPNQVPRLALPQGSYWPSATLFGDGQP